MFYAAVRLAAVSNAAFLLAAVFLLHPSDWLQFCVLLLIGCSVFTLASYWPYSIVCCVLIGCSVFMLTSDWLQYSVVYSAFLLAAMFSGMQFCMLHTFLLAAVFTSRRLIGSDFTFF